MSHPSIHIRLQYIYPEADRSFFRARTFTLSEDQITQTGLFGNATDIAGLALSVDCIHLQFNEVDFFDTRTVNALDVTITGPANSRPSRIWISDSAGFIEPPTLRQMKSRNLLSFSGQEVDPDHYLRLEWTFEETDSDSCPRRNGTSALKL